MVFCNWFILGFVSYSIKFRASLDLKVENLYNKYGSLAVFFSAFTPIPYKIFTIASGILNMNFIKFFIASFFGRGLRFFIVSLILMFFGEAIKQYVELVIIAITIIIVIFFVVLYKKRDKFK